MVERVSKKIDMTLLEKFLEEQLDYANKAVQYAVDKLIEEGVHNMVIEKALTVAMENLDDDDEEEDE